MGDIPQVRRALDTGPFWDVLCQVGGSMRQPSCAGYKVPNGHKIRNHVNATRDNEVSWTTFGYLEREHDCC